VLSALCLLFSTRIYIYIYIYVYFEKFTARKVHAEAARLRRLPRMLGMVAAGNDVSCCIVVQFVAVYCSALQ